MTEPKDPKREASSGSAGARSDAERRVGEIELVAEPVKPPGKKLFVGVRVSVATANALSGAVETLARRAKDAGADIRWVAPASYHVTLKYLGWTREAAIAALCDAIAAAVSGAPRLTFRTTRLGGFPSLDKATVVWAGVEGDVAALHARIEGAVTGLGFAAETRPFHPHVTLGRLRETRALKEVVLPLSEQMFSETRVDAVTLFESEMKSGSSTYKEIAKISFDRAENPGLQAVQRQTNPVELSARTESTEPTEQETDDGWGRGQGPSS